MENTRSVTLISIPNCDQLKKAKTWLAEQQIPFQFRDMRKNPLSASEIREIADETGIDILINRRSTTWRTLQAAPAVSFENLVQLATENPTLMKRPVAKLNGKWTAGFDENFWKDCLR